MQRRITIMRISCILTIGIATIAQCANVPLSSAARGDGRICKCSPSNETCWPTPLQWINLNATLGGGLIFAEPVAVSCYPGPFEDRSRCADVVAQWANASFQADQPLGLDYPVNVTCLPVNYTAGEKPGVCSASAGGGGRGGYAVNATMLEDVSVALRFAESHGMRVVVKTTGHDLLGRSEGNGDGDLIIWLRHLRRGVEFQDVFTSKSGCHVSNRTGAAISIRGGYTWADVYPVAKENNVVVVGGGTPTVGCMGGWMQGGGHGPASRQFGLGADQVLEAEVILANGSLVLVNACENSDLFFAIRGGGPGTYGIVVSTTVKAWPMVSRVVVQHLAIAPLMIGDTTALLDATAILFEAYPDLNDAGFAGYGSWTIESPIPLFANFTAGYVHGVYMFSRSIAEAKAAFAAVREKLRPYNGTRLFVSETYVSYPDYWTFYWNESGVEPPVGSSFAGGSRLFDRLSVQSNFTKLREMIRVLAGLQGQSTFNSVELVSGGQVFADASDPFSGLLPAWRTSYFNNIASRSILNGLNETARNVILTDVADVKVPAMVELAPNTGVYMNEADRLNTNYEEDFYGAKYQRLRAIKATYDPTDLFYCPTCVGSSEWQVQGDGILCTR